MRRLSPHAGITRRCRPLAWWTLVVSLVGCSSWQVPSQSPRHVIAEDKPSRIEVTLRDRTTLDLERPHIVGDSLIGYIRIVATTSSVSRTALVEHTVPLDDVVSMKVHKTDVPRSVLAGVGVFALINAVLIGAYFISCSVSYCD